MNFQRIFVIVLDSVGIGALPDAHLFGDEGANTLGHIAEQIDSFHLPQLTQFGLGLIAPLKGVPPVEQPLACYGKMAEQSVGKDTMTGHWELMGLRVQIPFRTYPDGFPDSLIKQLEKETGRAIIGNVAASGTAIIEQLGQEQMETGALIVYTSADSVLQIAAHEQIIPLEELYRACEIARELTRAGEHAVGRVIARPYIGEPGSFVRTANRKDYALPPPGPTVMNTLMEHNYDSIAIGKIADIFSHSGVTCSIPTKNNDEGIDVIVDTLKEDFKGLAFANLVDFDSKYGHRRDVAGYAAALEHFDSRLPEIWERLRSDDLLIITADHGNDPTYKGTDHTREYVPLLVASPSISRGRSLGVRETFSDVAATIADIFQVSLPEYGTSFLQQLPNE